MLHVRNASGYYGAERCIVTWMRELAPRGYAFDLAVYPHEDASMGTFLDAVKETGASLHELPRGHAHAPRALAALVRLVRARRIDVLHAHENRSHVMAWLAGGLTGRPVVGTLHGYVPSSPKMVRMNALNRAFLRSGKLSALTVPTRRLADEIGGATVMPNALPAALAEAPLAAVTPEDPPAFGVVGRLNPEKGIVHFLDAVGELPATWRFLVVGDGALRTELSAHPAAARVEWLGFRADAPVLMRELRALVIPSLTEGVPLTLLEAMAQGVPVIASAVGGIPEVLTDGRDALLVPPADTGALAAAMRRVASEPGEARARAEAARERFLSSYTTARVADELDGLYRRLVGSAR